MSGSFALFAYDVAHLPELTDLWVSAWNEAMPAIDFEQRRAWFVDHLTSMRDMGVEVTCAFDTGRGAMAGFITLDISSGHIEQLAVAPIYWGQGVAEQLIRHAQSASPHGLRLDVNQHNTRAVRLYEKIGFHRRAAGTNPGSGLKTWRYEWKP